MVENGVQNYPGWVCFAGLCNCSINLEIYNLDCLIKASLIDLMFNKSRGQEQKTTY